MRLPILVPILAAATAAQTPIYSITGDKAGDNFGVSVAYAGDVNLDGFADFVVGIWSDDTKAANAGAARVISGKSGATIHQFYGAAANDNFGISVAGAGDVDRDGWKDVVVGAWHNGKNGSNAGSATVYSGRTGQVLYTFYGDSAGDSFGVSVSGAGDVNNDGYADVIVGAHLDDNKGSNAGMARVFSGFNGAVLHTFDGDSAGDYFGQSVGVVGDVNADGHSDVIVGAYGDDNNGTDSGSAKVLSGKDGKPIYLVNGDNAGDSFGDYVAFAGDVNKDGVADFIVGATGDDNSGTDSGSARVFSGKDGKILYTFSGDNAGDYLGYPVNHAGDIDNDGYADLIVGIYGDDNGATDSGCARAYSGKDGKTLFTLSGSSAYEDFGIGVCAAGDVDGDGFDDVVVGADLNDTTATNAGRVWVYSIRNLALRSDRHTISVAAGGSQKLSIDHGATHKGRDYWVFGSLSGIRPGVPLGGVVVPLVPDPWTDITLSAANTQLLANFRGKLSATGTATATLTVPANTTSAAIGLTFHHAVLVYDSSGNFHAASNPTPLALLK